MYIVYRPVKLHYENMIYADISIYVPGAFSIKHIMLSKYKKKSYKRKSFYDIVPLSWFCYSGYSDIHVSTLMS